MSDISHWDVWPYNIEESATKIDFKIQTQLSCNIDIQWHDKNKYLGND